MKTLDKLPSLAAAGACLALAALAAPAQASVTSWGPHGVVEFKLATPAHGNFTDSYDFSLSSLTSLTDRLFIANTSSLLDLMNGQVALYRIVSGVDQLVGSFGFPAPGETYHTFDNLVAGSYHYLVTGDATGSRGGMYAFTSSALPGSGTGGPIVPNAVPEPQTGALLVASLAGFWLAARRRRSSSPR